MGEHAQRPRLRVAMVTNIPAPYRMPVYDHLARDEGIDLCVMFCADREPDRDWDLPPPAFRQVVLSPRQLTVRDRYIHVNFDVWGELERFVPDVVVTTGYNPTHLLAWAYARRHGAKHVVMTDGTFRFEQGFSALHRWVRRRVMASSRAFIGASDGALELFRSYGVAPQHMFRSQLCTDNTRFQVAARADAPHHDLMFCGRFATGKLPLFALDVACATGQRLGRRVRLLMVGAGPLEAALRERACAPDVAAWVECSFPGFARQSELPAHYASARVFLFTTERDAWGVVANEACAAGLPVIVTPEAGVAHELVVHGDNGYVLAPVVSGWSEAAAGLLADAELRLRMGERSRERVRPYTHANAAAGIAAAARHAMADHPTEHPRPTVLIVQRRLTHYRVVLFERLRKALDRQGVELRLVYGEAASRELSKRDGAELAWAQRIPTRYALRGRACWQDVTGAAKRADLVIVTQENRLIFNYVLHALKPVVRWALWGHGRNFQASDPNSMPERFKRWFLRKPDWWFAYTERSAAVVRQAGYAADRITVLNNALETDALLAPLSAAELAVQAAVLQAMAIGPGPVGLMLGSLYADKRIDMALQAARLVRREVPDFQLLIVGDGALRHTVQDAVRASDPEGGWIRWLGRRTDTDKAALLRRADLLLNPGALGLVMLDSFASGTPLVTCDLPIHGPESAYLQHGVNGWVAPADAPGYAREVCRLLRDPATRAVLRQGCLRDAQIYTLDAMVERFCQGVLACLAAPPRRQARRAAAAGSKGTAAS